MKYVNRPKIAAVKDINIIISMISLIFWVRDIDISKGDINPPLVESSNTILNLDLTFLVIIDVQQHLLPLSK